MKVIDFDLKQTLECGQCFNFERIESSKDRCRVSAPLTYEYVVVAFGRMLRVRQTDDELEFLNATDDEIKNIWIPYFDLKRDYGKIKREIAKTDARLEPIVTRYGGIRILNQEFEETLLSFIISQNKNIPQIKKIIRRMSEKYGQKLGKIKGREYHSFPSTEILKNLSEQDFKDLGTGFRAPYLKAAAEFLSAGKVGLNDPDIKLNTARYLQSLTYDEAKTILTSIKGVGDKVANCTLLFSLGFRNAFPVDVWIERIMKEMYFSSEKNRKISRGEIERFASQKFGEYGGYAQQYLFIYAKDGNIQE